MPSLILAVLALVATSQVTPSPEPAASPELQSGPILRAADTWGGEAFVPHPIHDENVRVAVNIEPQAIDHDKKAELEQKVIELNRLQRDIDILRSQIGAPQQILVKVQMLEVSLSKMREKGLDLDVSRLTQGLGFEIEQGDSKSASSADVPSKNSAAASSKAGNTKPLAEFVKSLCENNLARVLTEPNIITVSGRPAQFNVGGEFPVPARGDSEKAVDFQEYGTRVDVVAISQGEERVRLEIRTRVSEIDDNHTLKIGHSSVPALSVRQIDTAVETKFGQSAILSGLVDNRPESCKRVGKDGVAHVEERNNEIALVLIVTPERVDSLDAAQRPNSK